MRSSFTVAILSSALVWASSAAAQVVVAPSEEHPEAYRGAPIRAFEAAAEMSFVQGVGRFRTSERSTSIGTGGVAAGVLLGARVDPHVSILWHGRYEEFSVAPDQTASTALRGVDSAVDFVGHLRPAARIDPWLSMGAGYRLVWSSASDVQPAEALHALEVARLHLGLDLRLKQMLAIGPFLGADVDTFFSTRERGRTSDIADKTVSAYLYAGVQARFDLGAYDKVKIKTAAR